MLPETIVKSFGIVVTIIATFIDQVKLIKQFIFVKRNISHN